MSQPTTPPPPSESVTAAPKPEAVDRSPVSGSTLEHAKRPRAGENDATDESPRDSAGSSSPGVTEPPRLVPRTEAARDAQRTSGGATPSSLFKPLPVSHLPRKTPPGSASSLVSSSSGTTAGASSFPTAPPPSSTPSSLPPSLPLTPSVSAGSLPRAHPSPQARKWAVKLGEGLMVGGATTDAAAAEAMGLRIACAIPGDAYAAQDAFILLFQSLRDPKNAALRHSVLDGAIPVERLVRMSEADLMNPDVRRAVEAEQAMRAKDMDLVEMAKAKKRSSTMFKCGRCGHRDVDYHEMQTRSADEPMTVFITCNHCGNRWKR